MEKETIEYINDVLDDIKQLRERGYSSEVIEYFTKPFYSYIEERLTYLNKNIKDEFNKVVEDANISEEDLNKILNGKIDEIDIRAIITYYCLMVGSETLDNQTEIPYNAKI